MEVTNNRNKISKYFDLASFKQSARDEAFAPEDKVWTSTLNIDYPNYLFGIEIELENLQEFRGIRSHFADYWTTTDDGSLRNNGVEFVSKPLRAKQIEKALKQLHASVNNTVEFTNRTSCHVHMNVRDLTINEIQSLVCVYTVLEEMLFDWVGHDRGNNIFCMKITETEYYEYIKYLFNDIRDAVHHWNKYTALNIHPIAEKGTVEFRHLYGTYAIDVIVPWINILSNLKGFVKQTSLNEVLQQIKQLNTTSAYDAFITRVLGDSIRYFKNYYPEKMQQMLEKNVTYLKLALAATEVDAYNNNMPIENEFELTTGTTDRGLWRVNRTIADIAQDAPRAPEPNPFTAAAARLAGRQTAQVQPQPIEINPNDPFEDWVREIEATDNNAGNTRTIRNTITF